jgi:hypothetical protein
MPRRFDRGAQGNGAHHSGQPRVEGGRTLTRKARQAIDCDR